MKFHDIPCGWFRSLCHLCFQHVPIFSHFSIFSNDPWLNTLKPPRCKHHPRASAGGFGGEMVGPCGAGGELRWKCPPRRIFFGGGGWSFTKCVHVYKYIHIYLLTLMYTECILTLVDHWWSFMIFGEMDQRWPKMTKACRNCWANFVFQDQLENNTVCDTIWFGRQLSNRKRPSMLIDLLRSKYNRYEKLVDVLCPMRTEYFCPMFLSHAIIWINDTASLSFSIQSGTAES